MRRMTVLPLLLVVACRSGSADLTEQRKAEIVAELNALDAGYWDAWRAADWDRGMAYYDDSPDFVWAAGGAVYFGLSALKEARPGFANVARQTFTFRSSRTVVMAPDVASTTALGTWAQTDTAGVTGPSREFAWTAIWMRRAGQWKMHLVHMSYPVHEPEAR
jgi:ketosteroid isomerase-like protein